MEYITKQTKYDLYFISVKNRLKDYYAAANTIPYMQPELQASANLILKRLEDFINNRLFDTVKKFMDKDIIENGNSSNYSSKESNGHKCLITKYFVMMDHSMFEYAENNIRNYYTDVSLMSSIPTEQVMPALKKASEEFDKLAKCENTNDFEDIFYYKNATKALKAAARGDITLTGDRALATDGSGKAAEDGLEIIRNLIPQAKAHLAPRGTVLMETGEYNAEATAALAEDAGFNTEIHRDLEGQLRVVEMF